METLTVAQGRSLAFLVELRDLYEVALAGRYDGSEPLTLELWAGDDRAPIPLATSGVTWGGTADDGTEYTAAGGVVTIALDDADTAMLEVGAYTLAASLVDGGEPYEFWRGEVAISPRPGVAPAPRAYCSFRDMQDVIPWIHLARYSEVEQAGYAEARAEATRLVDATVIARAADRELTWARLGRAVPAGETADAVRAHLDAGRLLQDETVRVIAARYALAEVLTRDIGGDPGPYGTTGRQKIGQRQGAIAQRMIAGWTARIDADGDGVYELIL